MNQPLKVGLYSLADPNGDPLLYSTFEGFPLGTANNAEDGEIGGKVIIVAVRDGVEFPISFPDGSEVGLAAGSNIIGAGRDAHANWATIYGIAGVRFTSANASGGPSAVISAPASGDLLIITDIIVSAEAEMRVDFTEETTGRALLSVWLTAKSSYQFTLRSKLELVADKRLMVQTSATGNIYVTACGYSQ